MSTNLPPSVATVRIVFQSESGEACCVAVDPEILSGGAQGSAVLVLDDLPPGPATVTIAGFSTDFAPAVPGVADTCQTIPADTAQACDPLRVAAPAFESAPLTISIVAGVQTNLTDVVLDALPFLFAFSPMQGEVVAPPVRFDFTVVDAVTDIAPDSVELDVTFTVAAETPPGSFRAITKRIPLELDPCDDAADAPCSPDGTLDLAGFKAAGGIAELPDGPVEAHIAAENLGDPPRELDFRYSFEIGTE